jgi:hypothetical protein
LATFHKTNEYRGLGILHLETFARALRLIWLWKEWDGKRRPLTNFDTPCDMTDRFLYYYSIFNRGKRKCLTVMGKATASNQKSQLIVVLTVNTLTEASVVKKPPQLIPINGGGCPNLTASFKRITKAVLSR